MVGQSKPFDMKIVGYHRTVNMLPPPFKKHSLIAELKNCVYMYFIICRFLLGCNYDLLLKIKTCDRCRHNKPPGSPLSSGVANTATLGTGFQQSDKRNMGGIVTLPACHQ